MPQRNWTDEQYDAIYTKYTKDNEQCNVLVNAAAGSGKTAVLVERIIQSIIPSENNPNPIDINKMLVVTFTNAAAAEMKERISDALEEKLEESEDRNDYLQAEALKKQISLIYDADIMTIDAFCIQAIRENFQLLDIDPSFGIADNTQLALLAEEAMEEIFDEGYENSEEDFLLLCDVFSDGRDDSTAADIIEEVYNFTRAMPNPDKWLSEKADMYLEKENNPWLEECMKKKNMLCRKAYNELKCAMEYIAGYSLGDFDNIDEVIKNNPPETENEIQYNWGKNYALLCYEYNAAKRLLSSDWDESAAILQSIVFERWPGAKDKEREVTDTEIRNYVKKFRDNSKELLKKAADITCAPKEEILKRLSENVYPVAKAISTVTKKFEIRFKEKKDKKNLIDFSDAEHLCLELFTENKDVREMFKNKYDEILMDEYQDSNALQEEIFTCISRGNNMFMVGDMKQSIYRFRRSDPMIFKSKCDTFKIGEDERNRKIILSRNFRSREEVLHCVNVVFERIMSEAVGDIEYNEEQRLNNGNTTYVDANGEKCGGYLAECCVLESQSEDGEDDINILDKAELEAAFIAHKIRELKEKGYMIREKDSYRKIQNRDITIIMSSYKNVSDIYIAALNKQGIDCFAESGGYFDRNEVKLVLSLIKIIQNPYRDIPLLGVMRSPIGGFADDELVQIRSNGGGMIYEAVCDYAKTEYGEKCRRFIEKLNRWRDCSKYMTCDRLLWVLYEETGIYAFAGALHGGDEARANLRLLFERAKEYESSGYKGLFHFIKYIERLEKKNEDLSGAKLVGEGHDVVRIMTIHKSKGLEFPVVFLAGCGKKFNLKDKKIPMHKDWGIGLDDINTDENYKMSTPAKEVVKAANVAESISEEERKLYVAMTRAKEKLIVTGVVNTKSKNISEYEQDWDSVLPTRESVMEAEMVCSADCYLDWIAPVARFDEGWIYNFVPYSMYLDEYNDTEEEKVIYDEQIKISDFKYGKKDLVSVPSKISVTAIKSGKFAETNVDILTSPRFINSEKSGIDRGNALHKVMQKFVPATDMDLKYVSAQIEKMKEKGLISEDEAVLVKNEKILDFYNSELGMRVIKSGTAVREAPFETDVPLSVFEGCEDSSEKILLQGIIDCYFTENDKVILIDYKSDFYNSVSEIKEKYAKQLEWYAYAIEKITGRQVAEKYIYTFSKNETVLC